MFNNIKTNKAIILMLFIYSAGITVVYVGGAGKSSSGNEAQAQQIAQLNSQIAQQNVLISNLQKDNDDIKAMRAIMEKNRAEKEAAERYHKEASSGMWQPDEEALSHFKINVFEAGKGK